MPLPYTNHHQGVDGLACVPRRRVARVHEHERARGAQRGGAVAVVHGVVERLGGGLVQAGHAAERDRELVLASDELHGRRAAAAGHDADLVDERVLRERGVQEGEHVVRGRRRGGHVAGAARAARVAVGRHRRWPRIAGHQKKAQLFTPGRERFGVC